MLQIVRGTPRSPISLDPYTEAKHHSQTTSDKTKHLTKLKKAKIMLDECQVVLEKALDKS